MSKGFVQLQHSLCVDKAHTKWWRTFQRECILVSAKHGEHASYSVAVLTLFVPICPRKLCAVHTCVFYLKAVRWGAFRHACHMCKVHSHTLVIGFVMVSWRGFLDWCTDLTGFTDVFFSKTQIHIVPCVFSSCFVTHENNAWKRDSGLSVCPSP